MGRVLHCKGGPYNQKRLRLNIAPRQATLLITCNGHKGRYRNQDNIAWVWEKKV